MASEKLKKLIEDVEELTKLMEIAGRPRVKDFLSIQIRKVETEISAERERLNNGEPGVNSSSPKTDSLKPKQSYDVYIKSNYSWDQSDKFVKIYLTFKGKKVDGKKMNTSYQPTSVFLRLDDFDGVNYIFEIKETGEKISPEDCYIKSKDDTLIIYLRKGTPGQKWDHLKAVEAKTQEKNKFKPPEKSDDPTASMMSMMKQLYDDGDDEMKRTIAKTMSESMNKNNPIG